MWWTWSLPLSRSRSRTCQFPVSFTIEKAFVCIPPRTDRTDKATSCPLWLSLSTLKFSQITSTNWVPASQKTRHLAYKDQTINSLGQITVTVRIVCLVGRMQFFCLKEVKRTGTTVSIEYWWKLRKRYAEESVHLCSAMNMQLKGTEPESAHPKPYGITRMNELTLFLCEGKVDLLGVVLTYNQFKCSHL